MNKKFIWIGVILIIVIISIVVAIFNKNTSIATSNDSYTLKQAIVEEKTIIKELTNSAEVSSGLTEKIEPHATYYFSKLCVEKNTYIKEGTKILKYTNGTYLKAPYDLVIISYQLPDEDEKLTNSHYIEVSTTETLNMSFSISQSDMKNIGLGQEVEVTINAVSDKTYKGLITSIDETLTNSKISSIVTFMNDDKVKLGMSGSCNIEIEKVENAISVPIEAIEVKNDKKYVIVVNKDGVLKEVEVEIGISDSDYVEIKSGLELGEIVQYKSYVTGSRGTTTTSTSNNRNNGDRSAMELMRAFEN